MNNQGTTF